MIPHCKVTCFGFFIALCSGNEAGGQTPGSDLAEQRMDLMRDRAQRIVFTSKRPGFPDRLEREPIFRYDDLTRGYVDGAVWRLGSEGRPLAIVTTELHPKYLGGSGRVVYDFLSISPRPFIAAGGDVPRWSAPGSYVTMQPIPDAAPPARTTAQRLFQMKRIMSRFEVTQDVTEEGPDIHKLRLRRLPQHIDRYVPGTQTDSDGAIFVFAAGRMPGVVILLETDGEIWSYGVGRLSAPCTLIVSLDGAPVWKQPPDFGTWSKAYNATNASATIPGYEAEQ